MKQRKKRTAGGKPNRRDSDVFVLKSGERALANGEFASAAGHFAGISESSPNYGQACKGHGAALLRMRKWIEALDVLQIAHEAFPNDPDILVNAGDAARSLGRLRVAEQTYAAARERGATGYQIDFGEAATFQDKKHWLKAVECWTNLNAAYPDDPRIVHNLGRAWHELGETDRAVYLLTKAFEMGGERTTLSMLALLAPHAASCDHEEVRRIRSLLGERLRSDNEVPHEDLPPKNKDGAPINIGYVSSFFHRRNWMKPVWALLNNHDRERFNIHLFADGPPDEINTEGGYVTNPQDSIFDTRNLNNAELAKLIRDRRIDVLIDLNGYSDIRRLGLWTSKAASFTVGWFNQYATSGMPGIELLIGDDVVIRPDEEEFYSENIVRLKQSYLTFQVGYATPDVEIPSNNEPFTFGCLGSGYKITPEVRTAWIRILKETSGTRLIVRNQVLGSDDHRKWFLEFFISEGIDPDRVILLGPAEHTEFLQTYGRIDLALDTFPYNGGTTTMEALWQGVPLICFKGDRWVSRTSATLLHSADLGDFIGDSVDDYVEIAKSWSTRKDELRKLRTAMRSRLENSSVCDGEGLARDFERIVFDIIS